MGKTLRNRGKHDYWRARAGTSRKARIRRVTAQGWASPICPACNNEVGYRCGLCGTIEGNVPPRSIGKPADASAGAER